jgi:tetratricopeptide (TPR) repeat protein
LQAVIEQYRLHARTGTEKIRQGHFQEALEEFTEARRLSRLTGDRELEFEATANISMVHLELGDPQAAQEGLREIILQSRNDRVIMGASYNLAVSLRKQSKYGRALFYARKAIQVAKKRREPSSLAMCHNLLGNIYLGQSVLDAALRSYRRALALRRRETTDNRFSIAILKENIGYCLILKRQFRRGIKWIEQALELASQTGDHRCQADCRQDLCYAYLLLADYPEATREGERALEVALAEGYKDIEKNCYYLLGEAAHLTGKNDLRDSYFDRLQKQYPEMPFLRDFLCAVDVSSIINLKG